MKTDVLNKMIEKAKGKKDGVYKMNGRHYLVKNGVVKLVSDFGIIIQPYGHFVTTVGTYKWGIGDAEGKKMLAAQLKNSF